MPLTIMLEIPESIKFTIRFKKGIIGVGSGGSDDSGHNDEYSPQNLEQVH